MSKDDPNFKRLGTIIVLFVIVLVLSVCQAMLLDSPSNYEKSIDSFSERDNPENYVVQEIFTEGSSQLGLNTALDIIGFFFGTFIVDILLLPEFMIAFIMPFYIIMLIVFWYLILDFIKDIEILGSSI